MHISALFLDSKWCKIDDKFGKIEEVPLRIILLKFLDFLCPFDLLQNCGGPGQIWVVLMVLASKMNVNGLQLTTHVPVGTKVDD